MDGGVRLIRKSARSLYSVRNAVMTRGAVEVIRARPLKVPGENPATDPASCGKTSMMNLEMCPAGGMTNVDVRPVVSPVIPLNSSMVTDVAVAAVFVIAIALPAIACTNPELT